MGKPDPQTDRGLGDRAKNQSPVTDGKTAGSPAQAGPGLNADPNKPGDKDDIADWGLDSGKTGLSIEAKIGMALIVLLIGAFGMVVWTKMNRKTAEVPVVLEQPEHPAADPNDPFGNPAHGAPQHPTGPDEIAAFPIAQTEPAEDPFSAQPPPGNENFTRQASHTEAEGNPFAQADPAQSSPASPPSPSDPLEDWADLDAAPAAQKPQETAGSPFEPAETSATVEPAEIEPVPTPPPAANVADAEGFNPLDEFFPARPAQSEATQSQPAPAVISELEPAESPFDDQPVQTTQSSPPVATQVQEVPIDFEPVPSAPAAPQTVSAPVELDSPFDEPAPKTYHEPEQFTPLPAPKHPLAAPPTDPLPFQQHAQVAATLDDYYVVEPNDNFWSISRKQYGTAKYFQALARYNAQRIPDPQKMRPGMKVLTPRPDVLETRYPDLFPRKSTGIVQASASRNGPSGFLADPQGRPMYRIGEKDTLTGIAQNHLGRSSRWIQIFEMNRDVLKNPNDLTIGAVLRLPADASRVQLSQGTMRNP